MDNQFLYSTIIEALRDELECHRRLLGIIREETQALRRGLPPDVIEIGNRKGEAFAEAETATRRRTEIVHRITARLGFGAPVSLTQLADHADLETRQILTGYREKFADILHSIKSVNESNRRMIALTLDHINHHIHFVRRMTAALRHYDQNGQIRDGNLHGGLISQAG
jgi:flagellar biosynthesis/type III secretory pathway chaperone